MFPHRIQAPSHADLELQVDAHLQADDQARVIVQFAYANQYDSELLSQLDALCARYGERLKVRFYSHDLRTPFDARVLLALPNVHALSLDYLDALDHYRVIGSLERLRNFTLHVLSADLPDVLSLPNLEQLQSLRISLDRGPAIDLAPIGRMRDLRSLSISVQSHHLDVLSQCPSISDLWLHRLPAKTRLGMVADMVGLRSLSVGFGSRERMPELHNPHVTELDILRVRGLNQLQLEGFPQLEVLSIEDQAQLSRLDLSGLAHLRKMALSNLQSLDALEGLKGSQINELRLIKTPQLDLHQLLDQQLPPTLHYLKLSSGKRTLDKQLQARQQQRGIAQPTGPF